MSGTLKVPEDTARTSMDSQEELAQSMIRKMRPVLPPDVSDAELEESVEDALAAEAKVHELAIAKLRLVFLVVLAALEFVLGLSSGGSLATTVFIAASAGGAFLLYRKLRTDWYHPLIRKLVPAGDAAIIVGAFAVDAVTNAGTPEVGAIVSSATACVFVAFSGALRLSRNAARISAGAAIAAWVIVVLISVLKPGGDDATSILFAGAFVAAALLGTGYLGGHVTRTIRRVVMNEVGRTRFASLFNDAKAAVRAREEALGVVSHDLRNPLHIISMTAELLMSPEAAELPAAKRTDFIRRMSRAAGTMKGIISDLLDVARMEAGIAVIKAPVACADMLGEVADLMGPLAADQKLDLRVVCPDNPPAILVDRGRFLQVFSNLIGNAIKFTPPGGLICVQAQRVGDRMRFSVSDTGPGIPPDQRDRIFQRLWQADRSDGRGLGLGLAIARAIIEAHEQQIGIEPQMTQGTTFWFTAAVAHTTEAGAGI